MRRSGSVVAKSVIEEALSEFGRELSANAVEALVSRVRKTLGEADYRDRHRDRARRRLQAEGGERHMTPRPIHRPSLVRTITLRLAITSILAIFLQVTIVVARNYYDKDDLNKSYVTREARALLRGVRASPHGLVLRSRRVPAHYTGEHAAFYAFRILDESGRIIAEHDGGRLAELSPWRSSPSRTQDLWLLDLSLEGKLHVAGGLRQRVDNKDVLGGGRHDRRSRARQSGHPGCGRRRRRVDAHRFRLSC